MSDSKSDEDVPVCDKQGDGWVIKASRAGPVYVEDRVLAVRIWEVAMWSYRNGADTARQKMREALGVS